jgi:hypothetical protein
MEIAGMRIIAATISTAIIALAVAAGPAWARTADAKTGGEISPPPCHAYEQNPDGSWKELSCAENGVTPPAPAKVSTRSEGKATR